MTYWRKMSTAPRNGRVIAAKVCVATGRIRILRVKFNDFHQRWTLDQGWNSWTEPLCWLPLSKARPRAEPQIKFT